MPRGLKNSWKIKKESKMRILLIIAGLLTAGCTSVEQVIDNKELYCSGPYKGVRAVGRAVLSGTTGVLVPDVCDTIDDIVAKDGV